MFCWSCGKTLKGRFCVFCGANVEEDIINDVLVAEEPMNRIVADDSDIAIDRIVSDEEFSIREQRYTREQNPPREYRQARERNPIREENYRRPHEGQRTPRPVEPRAEQEDVKKKGLKPLFILVPLLIIALVVAGWAFMGMQSTRAFNDAMEQGNHYLLAMDLEQAEAHFLRAVEISPREVEPYLMLADVYVLQDEIELAIDILEQGMEAVSESDREILEDKLEDVIQDVQPEIVGEVGEAEEEVDEITEEEEPLSEFYKALIAYHEFLSQPQSMYLRMIGSYSSLSWDLNTLRHGELVDFNGDGIPELILFPNCEVGFGVPFVIIGYQEGVKELYGVLVWGDAGSFESYEFAITSEQKHYLVHINRSGHLEGQITRTYLSLINGEFTPSLITTINFEHELGEVIDWENPIESFYVNSRPVAEVDFISAPNNYLDIVENRDFVISWDTPSDIQILMDYIEERLYAVGIDLRTTNVNDGENLSDAEARHQRIMNGDFSDFGGTFTNGHGERIILHADGRIEYEHFIQAPPDSITERTLGVFILFSEAGDLATIYNVELWPLATIYDVGSIITVHEIGATLGDGIREVEVSFQRVVISIADLGLTTVECLFIRD